MTAQDKDYEVLLPLMGEGVNEATIVRWLKSPGEKVTQGEPLLEVSTDKVDTEISAPASGYLIATFAPSETIVKVAQLIAQISANADAKPWPAPTQSGQSAVAAKNKASATKARADVPLRTGAAGQNPTPRTYAGTVRTSPLARKIARENGIDLREVEGSGLYGRITKDDALAYLSEGGSRVPRYQDQNSEDELFRVKTKRDGDVETLDGVPVRRVAMTKMRQLTAEHMIRSVRTSPHVTTTFEIDLENIVQLRARAGDEFQAQEGFKLTYTPFFIHAAIQSLKEHPTVNASVDGHDILYKDDINLGCAVAVTDGLIVPVLKRANDDSLRTIAKRLNDIVIRARNKKLQPDDVVGGTFSITNPGMFGSLHSQPIINQPQVAILSIGAIIKRPVVLADDSIAVHHLCQIGLTFDHRIIDGEGGARFLATLRRILESYGPADLK